MLLCSLASMACLGLLLPAVAQAAVTTGTVTISSATPHQGETLTAVLAGWTGATSYHYSWTSGGVAVGTDSATYTPVQTDVNKAIDVSVTGTDGVTTSPPVTATATSPVTGNTAPPSIAGTPQQGQPLTLTKGTWTGGPTLSDQWQSCSGAPATCSNVGTVNAPTYTPAPTDVGRTIRVLETATYAVGPAPQATSAQTAPVTGLNITPPGISGTPQQGQTLTEVPAVWGGTPASRTYQWEDCNLTCTAIPGATGPTYVLQPGDVGQTIVVVESIGNGTPGATSAATGVVTGTSGTSLVVPGSDPATNQVVTLVATITSSSPYAGPSGTVTFFNGATPISGCVHQPINSTSQGATAVCQGSFAAGTASLSAVYTPGTGSVIAGSGSAPTTLNVTKDATSTSLAVTKKVARNKRATYTATLVLPVSNSGPISPTGTIQFLDRGKPIRGCSSRSLNKLAATCVLKYKKFGKHSISARYSGDGNFDPSSSPTAGVQIIRGSTGPVVLGFITSTLQWTFFYHPTYTQVIGLRAFGISPGMKVLLACQGSGCPFSRIAMPTRGASSINLTPVFHKRHLRVGTLVTLRMTRSHWVGKYYSFTVRAGQSPRIVLSCLAVGRSRPGVGC